jgi:hypothetical protein
MPQLSLQQNSPRPQTFSPQRGPIASSALAVSVASPSLPSADPQAAAATIEQAATVPSAIVLIHIIAILPG